MCKSLTAKGADDDGDDDDDRDYYNPRFLRGGPLKLERASLLNFAFLIELFHLRFFLTLRLFCLTVLVLGALLSSFLEEALYKCSI